MNSQMTADLAAQRRRDLMEEAARGRTAGIWPGLRRRVPRWSVNWSRTTLASAGAPGRGERSWVIIISATTRGAWPPGRERQVTVPMYSPGHSRAR